MTLRIYPLLVLSLFLYLARAETFNCEVTLSGRNYNLNQLYGEHRLNRTMKTAPSTIEQELFFDLCHPLEKNSTRESYDQCPEGNTRACLVETNKKAYDEGRITRVIPLATEDKLDVQYRALSGNQDGLNLIFHGPSYPPDYDNPPPETTQEQQFEIDVICPPDGADSEAPTFQSYDGKTMKVSWKHRVVCTNSNANPPGGSPSGDYKKSTGSGIGYFFLVLLIGFLAYFVIGAYYKYNNYGSSGWDLIPHRDFWREVPYLLRDVFSHLCSLGRSRRGYVQV